MIPLLLMLQITTNCQSYGQATNCQTNTPSQGPDWNAYNRANQDSQNQMLQNYYRAQQARSAQQQAQQQYEAQNEAGAKANSDAWVRRQVGSLVAQGKCEEAKQSALFDGNFALAEEAVKLCTPAAPAKP